MAQFFRNVSRYPLFSFFLKSRFATSVFLAVIVGVGTGFGVVGFIKLIDICGHLFFDKGPILLSFIGKYAVIIFPIIGGILVGPLIVLAPEAKGHGVPEVMKAMVLRGGRIRPIVVFVKAFASAVAIGSGASVGREGPIVQAGSALGSVIGQWFHQNEGRIKNLVACGAAAGIAGVFNAPIAGVMFAVEVIVRDLTARTLSSVVIAAVASSIISRIYLGSTPAFFVPVYALASPYEIFLYFILGIISGFVALLFMYVLHFSEDVFDTWRFPQWLKPAVGGLILGVIGFLFPQVFGTGFSTIEDALHGSLGLQILVILIFAKILATSVTLGSGSSGGVFAPALFIGAVNGGAFGQIVSNRMPFEMGPPGAYALVGMASVFAGAAHAPVTAILIVFEMTSDYKLILPLMVSAVVATVIAQVFQRESIYTEKLKRSGIDLNVMEETRVLGGLLVRDAMDQDFKLIPSTTPIRQVADQIAAERGRNFFVLDQSSFPVGEIILDDLEGVLSDASLSAVIADDLAKPIKMTCYEDDSLREIAKILLTENLTHLVVLDPYDHNKIAGVLRRENVLKTYTQAAARRDELVQRAASPEASIIGDELEEMRFMVPIRSKLSKTKVSDLGLPESAVLISIDRGGRRIIPRGGTAIRDKDVVRAVYAKEQQDQFKKWLIQNQIKRFRRVRS